MIRCIRKVMIRPDGVLLLSVLVFFLDWQLLIALLANVWVHEVGHLLMLRRYGVYIRCITLGFSGVCMQCNMDYLPRGARILCALFGPLLGLCVACVTSLLGNMIGSWFLLLFAGVGAIISLFNLLPLKPMDGWRIMWILNPRYANLCSAVCAVAVMGLGLYLMFRGYGIGLSCLGVYFLTQGYS